MAFDVLMLLPVMPVEAARAPQVRCLGIVYNQRLGMIGSSLELRTFATDRRNALRSPETSSFPGQGHLKARQMASYRTTARVFFYGVAASD